MIRNIVFDMGQVLIHWEPEVMLSDFDLNAEERKLLLTQLFRGVEWIQQDRGVIGEKDVIERVCARLPEHLHGPVAEIVLGWYRRHCEPMEGMGELVRELKEKGYGIYLLSNAGKSLRSYFCGIPGAECFDGLMVSAEEKLLKPQHEIYERLYERFSLNPEECWFVDDSAANVEGAILTGMQGTIFRGSAEQLRHALADVGIL